MGKRTAEGDDAAAGDPAELPPSTELVPVDCDSIVPSELFAATHVEAGGTVVFQSAEEAVVANLHDGTVYHRFDRAAIDVHGLIEDPETGAVGVCISHGDTVAVVAAAIGGGTVYSEKMTEAVCGGEIAVSGGMFMAIHINRLVLVCPFVTPATQHTWVAPAPVEHLVRCRSGPPVIVLSDRTVWRAKLGAAGVRFAAASIGLFDPVTATAHDAASGICVTREGPGHGRVLVSRAFSHLADVGLPVAPVAAAWEGRRLYVLGQADAVSHSPEVWVVDPAIGATVGTLFPAQLRFRPDDALADFNTICGRFVLWFGAVYLAR